VGNRVIEGYIMFYPRIMKLELAKAVSVFEISRMVFLDVAVGLWEVRLCHISILFFCDMLLHRTRRPGSLGDSVSSTPAIRP